MLNVGHGRLTEEVSVILPPAQTVAFSIASLDLPASFTLLALLLNLRQPLRVLGHLPFSGRDHELVMPAGVVYRSIGLRGIPQ